MSFYKACALEETHTLNDELTLTRQTGLDTDAHSATNSSVDYVSCPFSQGILKGE